MFDVVVDPDVIEQLASRLDVLSTELTHLEWAHLVGLLGLGSTALADAVRTGAELPSALTQREIVAMGSPGFADALNPAAEAIGSPGTRPQRVVIVKDGGTARWEVISRPGPLADASGVHTGRAADIPSSTDHR
jgi:hypothetical protein